MFLSQKSKGFFIEVNEHAVMLARTSSMEAPFLIEEVKECPAGDANALKEAVASIQLKKNITSHGYINAAVGIYPGKRLIRKHALDVKRLKEPEYITEVISQQLRIEQDKFIIHIIDAIDGADCDLSKSASKEALFCGIPLENLNTAQDALLAVGIYPERVELGSIAAIGALRAYIVGTKTKTTTLMLEIGHDSTHSFIVSLNGLEAARLIPQGLDTMVPVVQKELGLKDEEAARRLFYSNTFDFTGMGQLLLRRLLKELQSFIGFYEVQTGQSVGQIICTQLMPKLGWLESAISTGLGLGDLKPSADNWLEGCQINLSATAASMVNGNRWLGLLSLMAHPTTANALLTE